MSCADADDSAFVNQETGLRNIEEIQMAEVDKVRKRIDQNVAASRFVGISSTVFYKRLKARPDPEP